MEEAYRELRDAWASGARERETGLRLLYLSWMHWAETDLMKQMPDDPDPVELWHALFDHFGGEQSSDAEFLHVAAIMATITPWALGDEAAWVSIAKRMEARSLVLRPSGFAAELFDGRGEYGDYFAHQSRFRSEWKKQRCSDAG